MFISIVSPSNSKVDGSCHVGSETEPHTDKTEVFAHSKDFPRKQGNVSVQIDNTGGWTISCRWDQCLLAMMVIWNSILCPGMLHLRTPVPGGATVVGGLPTFVGVSHRVTFSSPRLHPSDLYHAVWHPESCCKPVWLSNLVVHDRTAPSNFSCFIPQTALQTPTPFLSIPFSSEGSSCISVFGRMSILILSDCPNWSYLPLERKKFNPIL